MKTLGLVSKENGKTKTSKTKANSPVSALANRESRTRVNKADKASIASKVSSTDSRTTVNRADKVSVVSRASRVSSRTKVASRIGQARRGKEAAANRAKAVRAVKSRTDNFFAAKRPAE